MIGVKQKVANLSLYNGALAAQRARSVRDRFGAEVRDRNGRTVKERKQ